jgi:hypothetical protein
MSKKLTQAEFISKAIVAHGVGHYDYSLAVYAGSKQQLTIICLQHGAFEQSPNSHLKGAGCALCWQERRASNNESFLKKAQLVHGDKYDYSMVSYQHSTSKVSIICPQHGAFSQAPSNHLTGNGCPKCGNSSNAQEFIIKAQQVHSEKYSYTSCRYKNNRSIISIICPQHGPFNQSAANHLAGRGCPACANVFRGDTEYFVQKARQQHGEKYDYSQVKYVDTRKKVLIVCPQHGQFEQSPSIHLKGAGCLSCSLELGHRWSAERWAARQKGRLALLYVVQMHGHDEAFYKVGITFYSIKHRFASARAPYNIEPVALFSSIDAVAIFKAETAIKKMFKTLRHQPSQTFAGCTECFKDDAPILEFLASQNFVKQTC